MLVGPQRNFPPSADECENILLHIQYITLHSEALSAAGTRRKNTTLKFHFMCAACWKKDKTNFAPVFQLLGDYDKVKTVSSGSDCVCRCIVRPIKRSDCSRIHDSDLASLSEHFYTVETVTKGTDCKKCVCMAPPSAVNPCEGEYRFKKLQEASKDDIKVETHTQYGNLDASTVFLEALEVQVVQRFSFG